MEPNDFDECGNSNPIDLSRRRDSVETRKTPSPYNSSNFGGSSPSILNDSPSTATVSSNNSTSLNASRARAETPTHHYQTGNFMQHFRQSQSNYPGFYPYMGKRETPSPPENHGSLHHRHPMHEYGTNVSLPPNHEEISPYILHAVALQQKLVQSRLMERSESNDSSTASPNIPPTITPSPVVTPNAQYPMVMGRDGKLSRPFKAYPRNPLSITASLTASDSILDSTSAEKFNVFRKQMLDQIHAANGGHPTISNPKMRRTSSKSFVENITNMSDEHHTHQDQQQQRDQMHQLQQNQLHQENQQNASTHSDSSSNCGGSGSIKDGNHKDSAYFERRKKNNAAAKKSRDRRRIKEDEIAIRAAYLERENIELKIELAALKRQLSH